VTGRRRASRRPVSADAPGPAAELATGPVAPTFPEVRPRIGARALAE